MARKSPRGPWDPVPGVAGFQLQHGIAVNNAPLSEIIPTRKIESLQEFRRRLAEHFMFGDERGRVTIVEVTREIEAICDMHGFRVFRGKAKALAQELVPLRLKTEGRPRKQKPSMQSPEKTDPTAESWSERATKKRSEFMCG